jgi:hypothetical protein
VGERVILFDMRPDGDEPKTSTITNDEVKASFKRAHREPRWRTQRSPAPRARTGRTRARERRCSSASRRSGGSERSGDPPGDAGEGERRLERQLRAVVCQQADTIAWQIEHIRELGEALDGAIEALAELRAELDERAW